MHYGVVDADDNLVHYVDVPLPGPRLPHDMAFTENYAILNDCPLFWSPEALKAGKYAAKFYPELPTRLGVIPRRGQPSEIRWFEADPTFVLHWVNAYEEGDTIVLDGFFQEQPEPPSGDGGIYQRMFRFLDNDLMGPRLHRWRLNLSTGLAKEERLTDTVSEFGMINAGHGGRPYRYSYSALALPGWFLFNGIVKHDNETGQEESYRFAEGVFTSETAMAPRVASAGSTGSAGSAGWTASTGSTASAGSNSSVGSAGSNSSVGSAGSNSSVGSVGSEDDGYLVTIISDMNRDLSECLVFDARDLASGPVCRVRLPERVSSGTHSTWAPGSAIPGWYSSQELSI